MTAHDTGSVSTGAERHYAYIDCMRGYAVLLVITTHLTYAFPNLPFPVRRLTILGWHGVQLFFVASALTLLMSWHNERTRTGKNDLLAFFIRRYCRIAPAYYGAMLLYFVVAPPGVTFGWWHLLGWMAFLNDWHPVLLNGELGAWQVVPGGWSISAEFSFYILFPIFATFVTSLRRAAAMFVVLTIAACYIDDRARGALYAVYQADAVNNFVYFWLPNQAPIFALGFVLYYLLRWLDEKRLRIQFARYRFPALLAAMVMFFSVTYLHSPMTFSLQTLQPPALLQASFAFALFILVAAVARPVLIVNRLIALVGQVSFSMYLVHFAIVGIIANSDWAAALRDQQRYSAIAAYGASWIGVVGVTLGLSAVSHLLIEQPGIALGRKLIGALRVQRTKAALG